MNAIPNGATNPAPSGAASATAQPFAIAFAAAKAQLDAGKLVEGLRALTKWYDNPQLTADESRQLLETLSQAAGTVVYSRQHLLQPAYKVQAGDTLASIATQYNVPAELLAKINGVENPNRLAVDSELKVLRGPFEAQVNLERRELMLMVEGCYAGRFSLVGIGDLARNGLAQKADGSFTVAGKRPEVAPTGASGQPPSAAATPIHHWMALTGAASPPNGPGPGADNVCIVGTDDPVSVHPRGLNLNARDAEDVYDILSIGSRVVVRR